MSDRIFATVVPRAELRPLANLLHFVLQVTQEEAARVSS